MFTHQSPAMASRYSVPSASTTVEPWPSTITIGSASSWRCWTAGWCTLSRSRRTTAVRDSALAATPVSAFVMSAVLPLLELARFFEVEPGQPRKDLRGVAMAQDAEKVGLDAHVRKELGVHLGVVEAQHAADV